jgi:amino acid transporter
MNKKQTGDVCAVVVTLGVAAISLAAWALLVKGEFGAIDSLSSLGLLVVTAIVGVGLLVGWLRDWRMLRTLREHLAKTRSEGQESDPRGPKGK